MSESAPAGAAVEGRRTPTEWAKAFAPALVLGMLFSAIGPGGHSFGALEFLILGVLGMLAAFLAGSYCRLSPAFRHVYSYHYLVGIGGLGLAWGMAQVAPNARPGLLVLVMPGVAAFSLAMLASTAVTDRRTATLLAATVFALVVVASRPLSIGPLNVLLAIVPAALAAATMQSASAVRSKPKDPEGNPVLEASLSQKGVAYVIMNVMLALLLLLIMKWSFGDYFVQLWRDLDLVLAPEEEGNFSAMTERFKDFPGKWLYSRLVLVIFAGIMAAILSTATQFRTADSFKAAACVFAAGCGANMAGGGIGTLNVISAMIGCATIAGACGILFAGGMRRDRLQRPMLAGGMAMVLALNLVEPRLPLPLTSQWAAFAVFLELILLGGVWALVYWFGIVRVRDAWPKPMPRVDFYLKEPPPDMPMPKRGGRRQY